MNNKQNIAPSRNAFFASMAPGPAERTRIADIENADPEFRAAVDRHYAEKHDKWISNLAPPHAAYLLKKLLRMASEEGDDVRIISGCLDRFIYNQLTGELRACIAAGSKFHVVLADGVDDEADNKFHRVLRENPGAVSLYTVGDREVAENLPHMTVVGVRAFRFEVSATSYKAEANFNNTDMAQILAWRFDARVEDGTFQRA